MLNPSSSGDESHLLEIFSSLFHVRVDVERWGFNAGSQANGVGLRSVRVVPNVKHWETALNLAMMVIKHSSRWQEREAKRTISEQLSFRSYYSSIS
jgi:hypothetical protein